MMLKRIGGLVSIVGAFLLNGMAEAATPCDQITDSVRQIVIIDVGGISTPIVVPFTPQGLCHKADFNGDGKIDLLVQGSNSSATNYLFLADSSGNYRLISQQWSNGHLGLDWTADKSDLYVGDFNADGRADILLDARTQGGTSALLASGVDGLQSTILLTWDTYTPVDSRTTVAGSTSGAFNVSDVSGAATYDIPIVVPPGIAGMQPELSLSYNSQGGNGLLGVGWSLSGLSSISRCPKTVEPDGVRGTIKFDANDRFCLDGQRLVAVNGTTYGAVGAQYRTEVETYTKINSSGGSSGQPQYFVAQTKSGLKQSFGLTANSRFQGAGTTSTMTWALERVEDTVGNYMTFEYRNDAANGQYYITRINYTGHGALSPARLVLFEYDSSRPDPMITHASGTKYTVNSRLTHIKTFLFDSAAGSYNQLVRDYVLSYDTAPVSNRSRLVSVKECGPTECFAPLAVTWNDGSINFNDFPISAGLLNKQFLANVDVTGNGVPDLCYRNSSGGVECMKRDTSGQFSGGVIATSICSSNCEASTLQFIDVNSDGYADIIYKYNNEVRTWYGTGTNFANMTAFNVGTSAFDSMRIADVNGDGYGDLCYRKSSGVICKTSTQTTLGGGSTTFNTAYCANGTDGSPTCDISSIDFADLNADGMADLGYMQGGRYLDTLLSTGTTFNTKQSLDVCGSSTNCAAQSAARSFADINGDALPEFCYRHSASGIRCHVNTAKASPRFNGIVSAPNNLCANGYAGCNDYDNHASIHFFDVTNDGMADIVYRSDDDGVQFFRSTGTGFSHLGSVGVCFNTGSPGTPSACVPSSLSWTDGNGDGRPDLFYQTYGGDGSLLLMETGAPDLVAGFRDGYGAGIDVTYKPMTDAAVYTKGPIQSYPFLATISSMSLVRSYSSVVGGEAIEAARYSYENAVINQKGRGFMGFKRVNEYRPLQGIELRRHYLHQTTSGDYWKTGLLERESIHRFQYGVINGNPASTTTNTWNTRNSDASRPYPYLQTSETKIYAADTDYRLLSTETAGITSVDSYGNVLTSTQTVVDAETGATHTKATTNVYDSANTSAWILGRLNRSTVTTSAPGPTGTTMTVTRVAGFEYYAGNGLLKAEIIEPSDSNFTKRTEYVYDAYGNKTQVTVSGTDISTRATYAEYDDGYFANELTNALGHREFTVYDPRFGLPTSTVGPNSLATFWDYDQFGRKVRETRADGTSTSWSYQSLASNAARNGNAYSVTVSETGKPSTTTYLDPRGLEIESRTVGFDGQTVYQRSVYDNANRLREATKPYFTTASAVWSCTNYDSYGRVATQMPPKKGGTACGQTPEQEAQYLDRETRLTTRNVVNGTAYLQETREWKDYLGRLAKTQDQAGNQVLYFHDPVGNLVETRGVTGTVTTISYDKVGRKTSMDDPDMGVWTYTYYVDDSLKTQTDAVGNIISHTYDQLGRPLTRTDKRFISAGNYSATTTTWTYDTASRGVGKLASVSGPEFGQTVTYDSYGRIATTTTTIEGQAYETQTSYDSAGRLATTTYPDIGGGRPRLTTRNVYNSYGYLSEIQNAANNRLYWQAQTVKATGEIGLEKLGDGTQVARVYDDLYGRLTDISAGTAGNLQSLHYVWDTVGNLRSRADNNRNLTETFEYDNLNRLETVKLNSIVAKSYQYEANGNIKLKSDFGTTYEYGQNGAGPHAVGTVKNGTQTRAMYYYNDNGALTSRTVDGVTTTVDYAAFNKPLSFTKNGVTSSFKYDAGRERMVQTLVSSGNTTKITYLNLSATGESLYEKEATASETVHKHYIYAPTGRIAVYEAIVTASSFAEQTKYLLKDHLGSVDVVVGYTGHVAGSTGSTGTLPLERLSFDAFGARRDATNWTPSGSISAALTDRGYTGHEHMDDFGLINMNGRVYDPMLGRFLSADPNVQAPKNSQSFNRYSYVLNNPLSLTDPTGYFWKKVRKAFSRFEDSVKDNWVSFRDHYIAYHLASGAAAIGFVASGGQVAVAAAAYQGTYKAVRAHQNGLPPGKVVQTGFAWGLRTYGWVHLAQGGVTGYYQNGGWGVIRTGVHHYGQQKVREGVERVANKNGMSLDTLNLYLTAASFAGDYLTGEPTGRFRDRDWNQTDVGFRGFLNRTANGFTLSLTFDVVDTVLVYQGLPSASGWKFIISSHVGSYVSGHSLGAAEGANLVGLGFAWGANVWSLPFGNIAPGGVNVVNGDGDLINGGPFGQAFFNFDAETRDTHFSLNLNRSHSCSEAGPYPDCGR